MMKIITDYQKDPFTGKIRYPGERYEEFDRKTEEQKETERPKRVKKSENE